VCAQLHTPLAYVYLMSFTSYAPSTYPFSSFFFFNPPSTTAIYTLSLHDALPIYSSSDVGRDQGSSQTAQSVNQWRDFNRHCGTRSEEHTSELQSLRHLVCRLLLEKKKKV